MRNRLIYFLGVVYPIALAVLLALLAFTVIPFKWPLAIFEAAPGLNLQHSTFSPRYFLLLVSFILMAIPAFRNYEKFTPKQWKLKVYMDTDGIKAALQAFSKAEYKKLNIEEEWEKQQYNLLYLNKLTSAITQLHLPDYVRFTETTHTEGGIIIRMRKIHGWQTYHIEELLGFMYYRFADNEGNSLMIRKEFELMPTDANFISLSLIDIYCRWTKVIQPRFRHL